MSDHLRVIWEEGMLLSPQHLQQSDRYTRELIARRMRAYQPFDWGLTRLDIDAEALWNGRFSMMAAAGVFRDGTPFLAGSSAAQDPLPAARPVREHWDARQRLLPADGHEFLPVYLGIPIVRPHLPQLGPLHPGAPGPRYSPCAELHPVTDENSGRNECRIAVSRLNLAVLFPDDALGEYDSIPIAEIRAVGENAFELRADFMPPCLSIEASPWLVRQVEALCEALIRTSRELSEMRRDRGDIADFAPDDLLSFGKLRAVNAAIPVVQHVVEHRAIHPERVYLSLATLAGDLCTYSATHWAYACPLYDHQASGAAFDKLLSMIPELLRGTGLNFRIDLRINDSRYEGTLDERHFERGVRLFVGAHADDMPRLLEQLATRISIGSAEEIERLRTYSLGGIPIAYIPDPALPGPLPRRRGFAYFEMRPEMNKGLWELVEGTKTLVIVPDDFPGLEMELVGVVGS